MHLNAAVWVHLLLQSSTVILRRYGVSCPPKNYRLIGKSFQLFNTSEFLFRRGRIAPVREARNAQSSVQHGTFSMFPTLTACFIVGKLNGDTIIVCVIFQTKNRLKLYSHVHCRDGIKNLFVLLWGETNHASVCVCVCEWELFAQLIDGELMNQTAHSSQLFGSLGRWRQRCCCCRFQNQ